MSDEQCEAILEKLITDALSRNESLSRRGVLRGLREMFDMVPEEDTTLEDMPWDSLVDKVVEMSNCYFDFRVQVGNRINTFTLHQNEKFTMVFDCLADQLRIPVEQIFVVFDGKCISYSGDPREHGADESDILVFKRDQRVKSAAQVAEYAQARRFVKRNLHLMKTMWSAGMKEFAARLINREVLSDREKAFKKWYENPRRNVQNQPFNLGPFAANIELNDDEVVEDLWDMYKEVAASNIDPRSEMAYFIKVVVFPECY